MLYCSFTFSLSFRYRSFTVPLSLMFQKQSRVDRERERVNERGIDWLADHGHSPYIQRYITCNEPVYLCSVHNGAERTIRDRILVMIPTWTIFTDSVSHTKLHDSYRHLRFSMAFIFYSEAEAASDRSPAIFLANSLPKSINSISWGGIHK